MSDEELHRRVAEDAEFPQRDLTEQIVGAAIEVHRLLGPGLLESVYQRALERELSLRAIPFRTQVSVPVLYKGSALDSSLRLDLLVSDAVIVEVKATSAIEDIHRAQLLTYLRLANLEVGLLLNFNVPTLTQGLKRIINTRRSSATSATSAPLR